MILNLFALMVDANVPDIALEPDKTVKKVTQSPCQINFCCSEVVTGRGIDVQRPLFLKPKKKWKPQTYTHVVDSIKIMTCSLTKN